MGKILIIGAGRMAKPILYYLSRSEFINEITIAARSPEKARKIKKFSKNKKIKFAKLNINDKKNVLSLMKRNDCTISVVPYTYNAYLAKLAVESACNFIDLGGNSDIVKQEFKLSGKAKRKGIAIIPDCGLAPGLVSNLVALGLKEFKKVDSIKLRVGGLPQHPMAPLNYMLVFSVKGLINEYIEPVIALENGRQKNIEAMADIEKINFPGFGTLEAFNTSGGTSTLPKSFKGKVKTLNYKTIRYPGHAEKIKLLMDLGLTSSKEIVGNVSPREVLEKLFIEKLSYHDKDIVLLKVIIENKNKKLTFELVDYENDKLTAMMRCTGFPVAVIAEMIIRGDIEKKGTLKHEFDIPPDILINRIREAGLNIKRKAIYK